MKAILVVVLALLAAPAAAYDLIVYGGSPSGVSAAVAAAEKGADVLLIAAGPTVGGTISNGLGAGDIGSTTAVTGFQRRFYEAVAAYYGNTGATYDVEPNVAEAAFRDFLSDAGVTVVEDSPLQAVAVSGDTITSITTLQTGPMSAPSFIDASYTADVAAMAGAPFRLGYGDVYYYAEPYARERAQSSTSLASADVPGADAAFSQLPFFVSLPSNFSYVKQPSIGMPSMTFRLSLSKASNRVPFAATSNYATYVPAWQRWMRAIFPSGVGSVTTNANGTLQSPLFTIATVRGNIYDFNGGTAAVTNVPIPAEYFGTMAQRAAVEEALEDYMRNFLYFAITDSSVPANVRDALDDFGLNPAAFIGNDNWPYEPYVREGRRVIGAATLTADTIYDPVKRVSADGIAIGSYSLDGKLSVIGYQGGKIVRDQAAHVSVPLYEIPLGAMQPMAFDNLLVSVGFSASPTAYGSARMEGQYMALGEAAGITAYVGKLKGTTIAGAIANWYASIKYLLTAAMPTGRGAVIKLANICPLIPSNLRPNKGFDATTCQPVEFTP